MRREPFWKLALYWIAAIVGGLLLAVAMLISMLGHTVRFVYILP